VAEKEKMLFESLPTGKPNISFSELSLWAKCSWRHKLKFVDKIDLDKPGPAMDYGTAIHACHEHFINTSELDKKIFVKKLYELWSEHAKILPEDFDTKTFAEWATEGKKTLDEIPAFYAKTFPGWKPVAAEYSLFEPIDNKPHAFKGYIDAIISTPDKGDKRINWIVDVKTTSWGWKLQKKQDPIIRSQLVLYKNFWSIKENIDKNDIRCGFLLLKRTGKENERCEFFDIDVGEKAISNVVKTVHNMLSCVKRGIAIKSRSGCEWCEYKDTEHCT
jgi:hypothetical protein